MKKILGLLLVLVMTATLLVGCGSNQTTAQTSKQPDSSTTAAPQKVEPASEIQFWYNLSGGLGDEVLKLVDRFNKSQSKIKVTPVFQGKYSEANGKLQQALVSNTQPALAMVECHYYYVYDTTGQFEDLTPYMKRDGVDKADFFEGFMPANLSSKPGVYGLPFNRSTMVMYYNKDMFKEVGLDPDKPPTTWDELHKAAQKLAVAGSRWGFTTPTEVWPLMGFVGQAGGKMLNDQGTDIGFKDGSGAKALKFWLDMKNDGSMKVNAANAFGMTTQDFLQKRVGILWQSTAELNGIIKNANFNFGVAFLPKDAQISTPTGGTTLSIPAKSKPEEKEAAWQFIKFATSVDQIYEFSSATGYAPTRKSSVSNQKFQELWNKYPQYKVAFDQLPYAKDTTNNARWAEVESALWTIQQGLLLDNKYTPEQAVDEMSKAAQKVLK